MSSLTSVFTSHKYGRNKVWFSLCSFGAVHASCLQDYQNIDCNLCTLTCLIARGKAVVLSVSCSQQTLIKCLESHNHSSCPFMGSLLPPSFFKIRVKIVWADAHSALRVSLCTLGGSGQSFLPKELWEVEASLVQIAQNFGCNQGSINCLAPNHPGCSGLIPEHMVPVLPQPAKTLPPLHPSPSCPPCLASCHLPNCPWQQLPFGCWELSPSCACAGSEQGAARVGRQAILTETAQPLGRDTHRDPGCFGKSKYMF